MNSELKACPKCGIGAAAISNIIIPAGSRFRILCHCCGYKTKACKTLQEAKKLWQKEESQ